MVARGTDMPPLDPKHLEAMHRCLSHANRAISPNREKLLAMAFSFQGTAMQIERSAALIAESRDLLTRVDQLLAGVRR